jgi:hypothetical protein
VWLAGATGEPILPFHIETDRHWNLSSWDRTQIPKPFSRAAIAFGPPLEVASSSEETVEAMRKALESVLQALEQRTHEMLGRPAREAVAGTTRVR